jgi:autotransporter-associated beta strand protein
MKSCKFLKLAALSLGALVLALTGPAQTVTNPVSNRVISWNLDDYSTVNPTDLAGVAPATNWVDTYLNNVTTGLPDNSGAVTTMNLSYGSVNTYQIQSSHPGYDANGTANKEMLNGFLNAGPASWGPPTTNTDVAITNVPYAQYDVVVYLSDDTSGRPGGISDGPTTYYFSTMAAAEISGANALFVPTTQTNNNQFPSADFAFFPGLTNNASTFTTYPKGGNDQWLGIAAVQIIQSSNVYVLYGPSPASPIISKGQPVSFRVIAGGLNPHYQWQHAGTNILNATNAVYSLAATQTGQDGNYAVVVTNSFSAMTSAMASLTFYAPKTVEWVGGLSSTWDTTTFNWTVNGGTTTTNYADTDNARFDPLGESQSTVSLSDDVTPTSLTVSNASYLLTSGSLQGGGSLHVTRNGTLILDLLDTRSGSTLIDSGSLLQVENGDTTGGIQGTGALTNNGTLQFDSAGDYAYGSPIYGTGNITNESTGGTVTLGNSVSANYLVQTGSGTLLLQGANKLAGGLVVDGGTVLARVNTSLGGGSVFLNGGELQLDFANDFTGTAMTLAGGVLYGGQGGGNNSFDGTATLAMDSDIEVGGGDTFTLNSVAGLKGAGFNFYVNENYSTGTLILAGTNNVWGSVTVTAGALQIGNGGATGALGAGTIGGGGSLTFDLAGNLTVTNPITISGNLNQIGNGTLNLADDLTSYSGVTTVSAGTLAGTNTFNGPVSVVAGGTLAPGTATTIGSMTMDSDLDLGGNLVVKVNRSLVQSNDFVTVGGALNNTNNGIVTVNNLGPALKVGDTFTLFSQPVFGGNTLLVSGAGVVWTNNLAVNGSISVLSTTLPRPVITGVLSVASGGIVFNGTNGVVGGGFHVLSSTNLAQTNWTISASGSFDGNGNFSVTNAITPGTPQMFYRLQVP